MVARSGGCVTFAVHDTRFPRAASEAEATVDTGADARALGTQGGTWALVYAAADKGRPAAVCLCPNCSRSIAVSNSRIRNTGAVEHALVCTNCPWFDYVTLDGWAEAVGLAAP